MIIRWSDIDFHEYHALHHWHNLHIEPTALQISQLKAILEPGQRATKMVEILGGDPENAVIFLHALTRRSGGPSDPNIEVLDAMVIALGDSRLEYSVRVRLYEAALARGDAIVSRVLLETHRPRKDTGELEASLTGERPLVPRGRSITLGERKSLARRRRDDRLLALLHDPHPDVVAVLVSNPYLTEADILSVASRRPTLGASQRYIFESDKWRRSRRVKCALVLNPYTPLMIALRLCCCLGDHDLRSVMSATKLAVELREHAAELVALRRG